MLTKSSQAGRYSRRKSNPVRTSESALQKFTEDYCALKHLYCFHIPDWFFRWVIATAPLWAKKAFCGSLGGLPDCIILRRDGEYSKALLLELKTKTQLHGRQVQAAHDMGWHIARTPEQVMEIIDKFNAHNHTQGEMPTLEECQREVHSRIWDGGFVGTSTNITEVVYKFIRRHIGCA